MKCRFLLFLIMVEATGWCAPPVIERFNPRQFHIKSTITPHFKKGKPDELVMLAAYPQDCLYQTISSFKKPCGKIYNFPKDCGKYITYHARKKFPPLVREFDVTVYDIRVNWEQIKEIPPPSGVQKYFTQNRGDVIIRDLPEILKISRELSENTGNVIEYAKAAYLYVTKNYKYGNAPSNCLKDFLTYRTGNCGNLTAVYCSLLRAKNIPARDVLGIRPDGSCHVWAEFFLDGTGWIPVDVTFDLGLGETFRHFGYYHDDCVVMHKDLFFRVFNGRKDIDLECLQTTCYWFWTSRKIGDIDIQFEFRGDRIQYPTPQSEKF